MKLLSEAIILATKAHDGQVDKGLQPYILHSLRVALRMETEEERIVAVLHDVIEDTFLHPSLIFEMFGQEIMSAVLAISRQPKEVYIDYIHRCSKNPLAKKVKIADLLENMSPSRLAALPESEQGIVKRYEKALHILSTKEEENGISSSSSLCT